MWQNGVLLFRDRTEWYSLHKIPDFLCSCCVKRVFYGAFVGNAPICASTVLECSCCRIHCFVAAPSVPGAQSALSVRLNQSSSIALQEIHFWKEDFNHRVSRVLSFFSSRRNWVSPTPLRAGELPPTLWSGGRDTLARGRGVGGVSMPTRGHTLWCSIDKSTCDFNDFLLSSVPQEKQWYGNSLY